MMLPPELSGLLEDSHAKMFLTYLSNRAPSATLVGGAVRDLLLGDDYVDLDLVVNDDELVKGDYDLIGDLSLKWEMKLNRHGNWRFFPDPEDEELHIDLWSPDRFYTGFSDIDTMLAAFDCSVNAIGVRLVDGFFYDPVGGLADLEQGVIRLMSQQWIYEEPEIDRLGHLCYRLNKLMERYPKLRVQNIEVAQSALATLEVLKQKADEETQKANADWWAAVAPGAIEIKPVAQPPKLTYFTMSAPVTIDWTQIKFGSGS